MARFFLVQAILIALAIMALVMMFTIAVRTAFAHDWYAGKHDPVTGGSCCSTSVSAGYGDCAMLKVEPGVLTPEADGFRLRLTTEQARQINPIRNAPVDTFIPFERVQASLDGNYHLCIPGHPAESMRADFYCFWAPPST